MSSCSPPGNGRRTQFEKDLDRIQKIIERMAKNSFVIKGWSITLMTGLLAFGKREASIEWAALRLFPVAAFWALDAYYLSIERAYRDLYADKLTGNGTNRSLAATSADWWKAIRSPSVFLVYVPIMAIALLILFHG